MASKRAAAPARHLFNGFRAYELPTRYPVRSMATEAAPTPTPTPSQGYVDANLESAPIQPILQDRGSAPFAAVSNALPTQTAQPYQPPRNPFLQKAQCTLYNFPSLEPTSIVTYPSTHLLLPLRKDILHRAVIFEGDATRRGTASTKHRSEVHGSGRKIRPQKGNGTARLGDKKSPMLRGGGVAHGPKPRDFSTELPQKLYDRAWRTALSYRYRKGELVVTDGAIDVQGIHEGSLERYIIDVLKWNRLDQMAGGRSLFVTMKKRDGLFSALKESSAGRHARALEVEWVDVKDLLEGGRVIVEKAALERLFREHETDLPDRQKFLKQMRELATL